MSAAHLTGGLGLEVEGGCALSHLLFSASAQTPVYASASALNLVCLSLLLILTKSLMSS